MKRELHIAISPLTNSIFAGHIATNGVSWLSNKTDVTGEACAAVAQRALRMGGGMTVNCNGKPRYEIFVKELK